MSRIELEKSLITLGLLPVLKRLLGCYPTGSRRFAIFYAAVSSLITVFDMAALALFVFALTPLVTGSKASIPLVGEVSGSTLPWFLVIACFLFVSKSVFALLIFRIGARKLASYEHQVGNRIFEKYASSPWDEKARISTVELTRIVETSVSSATFGFLSSLMQVPGSAFTAIAVLIVFFAVEPLSAFIGVTYIGLFVGIMFRINLRRTRVAGKEIRVFSFRVAAIMTEMAEALKELTLRAKIPEIVEEVSKNRLRSSSARGELAFLTTMPRYLLEIALIGGILIIGGFSFLIFGPESALVSVAVFGAAALRLIPSLVMLQSSLGGARSNQAYAEDVINQLERDLSDTSAAENRSSGHSAENSSVVDHPREVTLENVSYTYPGADSPALENANLTIRIGDRLAIVGPSGSGKSTLVDLILGLRTPTHGSLRIDGTPLDSVLEAWRSRVGYVPQRVAIFDASIAQNIALTWGGEVDQHQVLSVLKKAQLLELLERPEGIEERLGERGSAVSGGQQQRIGLARALYANPVVLVLDEATSSLDTKTEKLVMGSLGSLGKDVTVVAIAHRLAMVQDFDQICYVDQGRIRGVGTFAELQRKIPEFAAQVSLAGLATLDTER